MPRLAAARGVAPERIVAWADCARRWSDGREPSGLPRVEPAGKEPAPTGKDVTQSRHASSWDTTGFFQAADKHFTLVIGLDFTYMLVMRTTRDDRATLVKGTFSRDASGTLHLKVGTTSAALATAAPGGLLLEWEAGVDGNAPQSHEPVLLLKKGMRDVWPEFLRASRPPPPAPLPGSEGR